MGAQKYTDAQRVTVLGLYVENVRFGEIVTLSGLDRHSVASILAGMCNRARLHRSPGNYYLKRKVQRIHDAESRLPSPRP